MPSPTLSIDFSFRPTLAFAPFPSIFPRRAPSLASRPTSAGLPAGPSADNSCILTLLRTLCARHKTQLLYNQANPNSFAKTPGVGYPSSLLLAIRHFPAPFLFYILTNPFSRKSFVCTSIQNPGGVGGVAAVWIRPSGEEGAGACRGRGRRGAGALRCGRGSSARRGRR